MPGLTVEKQTRKASAAHAPQPDAPARRESPHPVEIAPHIARQACACGGGCPRCQIKTPIQTKLAVNRPGDSYEQEADRAAEQVMRMPEPAAQGAATEGPSPARGDPLHGLGAGRPLDASARAFFEPRFGRDFSRVRVHTGERAAESARAIDALAYTAGRDIVFAAGQFAPDTSAGRRLLAHELTHVVQQSSGAPAGTVQRKLDVKAVPVPGWGQLPADAQRDLLSRQYDKGWFDSHDDAQRQTVLNLYVKLRGLGLWQFVGLEAGTPPGLLHFIATNVEGLKETLRKRGDFTNPEKSSTEWSSREKRASNALHLKHFASWPETKVQAHIDQKGLLLASYGWWAFPPVPLTQMIMHRVEFYSYQDVLGIRDNLLNQGQDAAPLVGTNAVNDLQKDMPTFEDCSVEKVALIRKHLEEAQRWVDHTVGWLEYMLAHKKKPAAEDSDGDLEEDFNAALETHFHISQVQTKSARKRELLRVFRAIQAGFAKPPFQCESSCKVFPGKGTRGYVHLRTVGDVHLCPCWFNPEEPTDKCHKKGSPLPPYHRTQDIVHEMAHKYANRADEEVVATVYIGNQPEEVQERAYEISNPEVYEQASAEEAFRNADSYAAFARAVYKIPPP